MHNISLYGWLLILVAPPLVVYWLLVRCRILTAKKQAVLTGHIADTRRLTGACFGNRDKADRLIQYEKNRHQGITHAEAVRRALERLETDRGR